MISCFCLFAQAIGVDIHKRTLQINERKTQRSNNFIRNILANNLTIGTNRLKWSYLYLIKVL
jgi:hypothetical protein